MILHHEDLDNPFHISVDLIIKIFSYLNDSDRRNLSFTCKFLRYIQYNFVGYEFAVFEPLHKYNGKLPPLPKNQAARKIKFKSVEYPFIYKFKKPPFKAFSIGLVVFFPQGQIPCERTLQICVTKIDFFKFHQKSPISYKLMV